MNEIHLIHSCEHTLHLGAEAIRGVREFDRIANWHAADDRRERSGIGSRHIFSLRLRMQRRNTEITSNQKGE
jgi:hypothetical protein